MKNTWAERSWKVAECLDKTKDFSNNIKEKEGTKSPRA